MLFLFLVCLLLLFLWLLLLLFILFLLLLFLLFVAVDAAAPVSSVLCCGCRFCVYFDAKIVVTVVAAAAAVTVDAVANLYFDTAVSVVAAIVIVNIRNCFHSWCCCYHMFLLLLLLISAAGIEVVAAVLVVAPTVSATVAPAAGPSFLSTLFLLLFPFLFSRPYSAVLACPPFSPACFLHSSLTFSLVVVFSSFFVTSF